MRNRDITYHWGKDNLLISLGNRTEPRIKMLFLAEFLLTSGIATVFLLRSMPLSAGLSNVITCIGSAMLYLLSAYRFLSRIFFSEKIIVDKQYLTIVQHSFFMRNISRYKWRYMGPLHYIGKEVKTDHPLKGKCYDYFGFETQEHLIQSLHHSGNLYFNYGDDLAVRFARGVYSWDAEEMVRMIHLFSGPSVLRLGPEWEQMLQEQEVDDN